MEEEIMEYGSEGAQQMTEYGSEGASQMVEQMSQMDPSTTVDPAALGVMAAFAGVWLLFWLTVALLSIIGLWKVFTKAGKPGWAAIIPFYNIYVLLQIVGRPGWWLLLFLIPFVNIVISVIVFIDLGKAFGKDPVYSVLLLWLLNPIGMMMLGFGKDQYRGPKAATSTQVASTQPVSEQLAQ